MLTLKERQKIPLPDTDNEGKRGSHYLMLTMKERERIPLPDTDNEGWHDDNGSREGNEEIEDGVGVEHVTVGTAKPW